MQHETSSGHSTIFYDILVLKNLLLLRWSYSYQNNLFSSNHSVVFHSLLTESQPLPRGISNSPLMITFTVPIHPSQTSCSLPPFPSSSFSDLGILPACHCFYIKKLSYLCSLTNILINESYFFLSKSTCFFNWNLSFLRLSIDCSPFWMLSNYCGFP